MVYLYRLVVNTTNLRSDDANHKEKSQLPQEIWWLDPSRWHLSLSRDCSINTLTDKKCFSFFSFCSFCSSWRRRRRPCRRQQADNSDSWMGLTSLEDDTNDNKKEISAYDFLYYRLRMHEFRKPSVTLDDVLLFLIDSIKTRHQCTIEYISSASLTNMTDSVGFMVKSPNVVLDELIVHLATTYINQKHFEYLHAMNHK